MTDLVIYELRERIAHITMNDGKVNVMSLEMLKGLRAAFEQAEQEADTLVLSSGLSEIFSAGFDLKVFAANDAEQSAGMVRAGAELARDLMLLDIPTLAVVTGHAFPMGTFLLLACDVRLGTQGNYRMGLNEVAIQITPPGFAVELARSRIHPAWLSRTVTLGEMFEPEDAVTAGILDRIVPDDELDQTVDGLLSVLANTHRDSHIGAKRRLRGIWADAMTRLIESELTAEAYTERKSSEVLLPA